MKTSKIFLALLALVLVVSLVACGGKEPEVTEPAATTTEAAATTTEAPATTTAAPVVTTTTAAPATTTKAPATTTKAPATTTKAPAATETPTEVAYKSGISTALTEGKNADGKKIFNADEIFANTVKFQSSTDIVVWNNTGDSSAKTEASAEIAVAWDGEYIYAFVEVTDPTITSKGQAWIDSSANGDLFYNDSFEFYYCFGAEPSSKTRRIVKMDAYGLVKFAGDGEASVFFDETSANANYSTDAGKYFIVFKVPAKAEDGTALKAGDTVYFSEQINDIRDASDASTKKVFCSGANRKYDKWVSFTLGAGEAAAEPATKVVYKEGISAALTANGNEFVADEIFNKTVKFQSSTDIVVWNNTGDSSAKTEASAEIAVAWDGAFIYAFIEVADPTLTTKGQAWVNETANADLFYNDSFEFYYCFGAAPDKNTRKIVKMDAYGYKKFAGTNEGSVFFDEIEAVGNYSTEAGKYYIVFKIPAKAEDGTALKAGDTVYFSEQINDIRDASDVTTKKVFCSGANRKYDKWVSFELAGK